MGQQIKNWNGVVTFVNMIREKWCSMAILITFVAAILIVSITSACASDYTFTNSGQTGKTGPNQTQADAAYSGTSLEGLVTVSNGIQNWTVPSTGTYTIKAYGAQGGNQTYSSGYAGGKGAYIQGDFELTSGEIIQIIVGQKGEDTRLQVLQAAPGGGGGTFVYRIASDTYPLVAAGGGGSGARCSSGASDIQEGNNATSGHNSGSLSNGGSNGNGGISNSGGLSYWAGGGAGWLTDGTGGNNLTNYSYTAATDGAQGGRAPRNGGYGGIRWNDGTDEGGDGGFGGGGGGGSDMMGGGGGGGYSGGGGARRDVCGNEPGGGGGSYNGGTNQVNTSGVNTGHGMVVITLLAENLLSSDSTSASEWRMIGRYNNHTGWDGVDFTKIAGLSKSSFTTGSYISSSPAVANGYVYIGSYDNKFYQLNASNVSQMIANYNIGNYISSSPAVANGYVYVGGYNNLYQLNASNVSQLIANYTTGNYGSSSPVIANGFVYSGSYNRLYQLNASNVSQTIANYTYTTGYYSSSSSPAVANGYVYIASYNKLYQLNASNISQTIANYTYTTGYHYGSSSSSPAVANGYVYIASYNKLYQLNASNIGQQIANYTYTTGYYSSSSSSPAVANGYVYIASYNKLYQLNASNISQQIANYNIGNYISSSPAVANGYLYIGSYDYKLYQFNASNISQLISTYTTGSNILSSPAVANGYVYVGSYDKKLYQLNASDLSLNNPDVTPPTISITTPENNSYVNSNLTIETIASDYRGINNVLFEYKNSTVSYTTLCTDYSSAYSCMWQTDLFSNASEGYDIRATAFDNSNNNASQILHLAIDRSIPLTKDITVTYPTGQTSIRNGQALIAGINTTDSTGSGINTTIINTTLVNSSGNTTMVFANGDRSSGEWSYWNKSIIINSSTGNHQLPIYVYDNATPNNLRSSDRFYVVVDNDVPTYSEFQDYGPVYNEENMIFRIKVADNYAAKSYIFSTNMSGSWVNDTLTTISDSSEPIFVTKTATTGIHSYRFYIFDDAGNVNVTGTNSFEVYENRPEFTIFMYNLTEGATSTVSNVNFTYKYINGMAINCSLYIDSAINQTTNNPLNDTILSFNQTFTEGTYQWYVGCIEYSTNNSYSGASRFFSVDWAPSVTINTPVNGSTTNDPTPQLNATFGGEIVAYAWYNVNNTGNSTLVSNTNNLTLILPSLPDGAHNVTVYINDSAGNLNSSIVYFTIDTIAPYITIISPLNTIYNNASITLNVTTNQTANVTYSLNGDTNQSLYNLTTEGNTTITGTEGANNITLYANDSVGNLNSSIVYFTIDTIAPSITIISPVNTIYSNASINLNITTNQTANVTYSLNGGTNQSLYNLSTSGNTTIVGTEGANNITVYANDSVGNLNYSIVYFTIDMIAPSITIISPLNTTYSNASITLNVTTNQTANVTYSLNGGTNQSLYNLTTEGNTTITGTEGANNIKVYANDSVGNLNSSTVYFTIDTFAPSITIISPVNTTYSNVSLILNITTNQTSNVTYSLNGAANLSLYNLTTEGNTTITGTEGANNITVYANDSVGNLNSSIVYFTIDTIAPSITIISPVNTIYSNASITLNVTTNQTANVTYSLNGGTNQSLYNLSTSGNTTIVGIEGANNIIVYANDSVGNLNSSIAYFTVDTTTSSPPQTSSGGTGGGGIITGEPFENIASFERSEKDLAAGKSVTYTFTKDQDIVYEVSVIGKENENNVVMRIEVLKDISKQVTESAPGLIYRNVNIILGTRKVGENVIKFKVKNSWLLENDLEKTDTRLVKWVDDKWITLETGVLNSEDGYTHFSSKSMTFSIYAITGIKKGEGMSAPLVTEKIPVIQGATPLTIQEPAPQPERKTPWLWMILAVLLIAALVYAWKKR